MSDSATLLPLANLVAEHDVRDFVEIDARGSAAGADLAARLNLHAHIRDTHPAAAAHLASAFPDFDVYDGGDAARFLQTVFPKIAGNAIFVLPAALSSEHTALIADASGERAWFVINNLAPPGEPKPRNLYPAKRLVTDEGFDRNWAGPEHLKPRVYRSQEEKDTWHAIVVDDEYRCPQFAADDMVIDIGMNIGAFSWLAHHRGSRNVFGFEPGRFYYQAAVKNLEGLDVVALEMAVVRSDGRAGTVYHDGGMSTFATTGEPLTTVTLDAIIGTHPVRFLKIDCEGAEWPILYTCTKLAQVQEIAGEYHTAEPALYGKDLDRPITIAGLEAFLREQGFDRIEFMCNSKHTGNFFARRS